jgi:hypothetical protein
MRFLVAVILCAVSTVVSSSSRTVVISSAKSSFGTWEGWGVSLAWWANLWGQEANLASAIFSLSESVIVAGVAAPGLGMTTARYNVGGSSNIPTSNGERMVASPNIPSWKQIEAFWIDSIDTPSSWNFTRDANQVAMLKSAQSFGALSFELFSNSPVWWMLKNYNPSGSNDGSSDNLMSKFIQNHSYYLVQVALHARDVWGVNFTSIELFNEPVANWWHADGTQEGCHFDASTQASALATLPQMLSDAGLNTIRIAASDESRIDMAQSTWNSWGGATRTLVDQFNVHGYQDGGDRAGLYQSVVVKGGKILHDSEYGDGDGTGGTMAQSILADWSMLHPRAWAYWQIIDVADGWGLRKGNADTGVLDPQLNTKWLVVAQFSRHIRYGSEILQVSDPLVGTAATLDVQRSNTLTIVVQNYDATSSQITIDLSQFQTVPVGTGSVNAWLTSTVSSSPTPGQAYSPLSGVTVGSNKNIVIEMGGWTIVTIEVQGVFR